MLHSQCQPSTCIEKLTNWTRRTDKYIWKGFVTTHKRFPKTEASVWCDAKRWWWPEPQITMCRCVGELWRLVASKRWRCLWSAFERNSHFGGMYIEFLRWCKSERKQDYNVKVVFHIPVKAQEEPLIWLVFPLTTYNSHTRSFVCVCARAIYTVQRVYMCVEQRESVCFFLSQPAEVRGKKPCGASILFSRLKPFFPLQVFLLSVCLLICLR